VAGIVSSGAVLRIFCEESFCLPKVVFSPENASFFEDLNPSFDSLMAPSIYMDYLVNFQTDSYAAPEK